MPDIMNAAKGQPIVEHAGTGFRIPESMARMIDEFSKGLPKSCGYRRRSASPAEFEMDESERSDISFITTDAKDRDGEVVLPEGGQWKNYNRVVPFAHKYDELPVGSNWWIRPKMKDCHNGLIAKTHYPPKPKDWGDAPWLPSAILHLMQQPVPVCTGKSIGFIPLNIRQATSEEKSLHPDWSDAPIIDKWIGLEYSVAAVPANDTAEMVSVSKALRCGPIDKKTASMIAGVLGVKDMVDGDGDGDGGQYGEMPNCPKCMSADHVVVHDKGYMCKACGTMFTKEDTLRKPGEQKAVELPKFSYMKAADYIRWREEQQKKDVERLAKQAVEDYIVLQTGGLRI